MTDQNPAYDQTAEPYAGHSSVNYSQKEYPQGEVHNNTAESFNAILERAKQGVFYFMIEYHLQRYLHEIGFRWDHRIPEEEDYHKMKDHDGDDTDAGYGHATIANKPNVCQTASPDSKWWYPTPQPSSVLKLAAFFGLQNRYMLTETKGITINIKLFPLRKRH